MRHRAWAGALIALPLAIVPAHAADDVPITRLATCQDSWLDWKDDPAKVKAFGDHLRPLFAPHDNDPYWLPKQNVTIASMHVSQVFPQSVGMALGFSATVDVPFEKARTAVEKISGKKLTQCENSDGMKTCGLQIAEKRTITVMAVDGQKPEQTLIGCYYYYEK
jgi:hypothetical protein